MAQGYYTLEEASKIAGISAEELKQMARRGEIRSFQDRGTWRFRTQDIEELARSRGGRSDPDLVLGEAIQPRPTDSPARVSGSKTPVKGGQRVPEVFDFPLEADDESIGLGTEALHGTPGGSKKPGSKSKPPSGAAKPSSPVRAPQSPPPSPKSPPPPPIAGSDSDVRLVGDNLAMDYQVAPDSDIRPKSDSGKGKHKVDGPATPPKSDTKRKSGSMPTVSPDSGARLVSRESDSDVRLVGQAADEDSVPLGSAPPPSASDSDVRLEKRTRSPERRPSDSAELLTEEINLDEELKKQETQRKKPRSKIVPKSAPPTAPAISSSDLGVPGAPPSEVDSSDMELTPAGLSPLEPSSDFDLTPAGKSPLEPDSSDAGSADAGLKGPSSGIRLDSPKDSGISLEQGGEGSDEIEFNIDLDSSSTPRPSAPAKSPPDSSSEFELTLDADSSPVDSSSEFELTLDSSPTDSSSEFELTLDAGLKSDSDSEFELTLDDSGVQSSAGKGGEIFDTDFDVPSLEEESGSDAVLLEETTDTDLDNLDLDMAIGDADISAEDESGSAVVVLEGEDIEDSAATVSRRARPGRKGRVVEEDDLGIEGAALDEEFAGRTVVKEKLVPAAPWGLMPVLFLLPCTLVMFLVTLMGYELVQSTMGYKSPGLVTRAIGGIIDSQSFKNMK